MTKPSSVLPALAAALLLSTAPFALAASHASSTANGGASMWASHASDAEHESKAEISAFEQAKVPLTQAIQAAGQHSHGKAIDASFENRNGHPVYRVKTFQNKSVWEGAVSATSGKVIGQGKTTPESQLDQEDKAELSAAKNAKTSLTKAVKAAEQKANGKAIDAGLEARNGKVAYELELVKNGSVHPVMINPQTGQIASNQRSPTANSTSMSGSSTPPSK